MKSPLRIVLENGQEMIINEEQVCSVKKDEKQGSVNSVVTMSNGEFFVCISPKYGEWENDLFVRS